MWAALLCLHLVGIVGYNLILRKSILNKADKWLLATLMQTGIGLPALIILLFHPITLPVFTPFVICLYLSAIILTILLQTLNVKALQYLEASIYSIVYNTRIILVSVLGTLLLAETITPLQLLGGVLIFCAVFIVQQKGPWHATKYGLLVGFAAAVTLSFLNITEKTLNQTVGFFEYFLPVSIISSLLMWIVVFIRKTPVSLPIIIQPNNLSLMMLRAFSAFGFSGALVFGPVAISNYVSSLSVIIMVICGMLFLNERDHLWQKLIATGIAVFGLTLIILEKL